MHVSGRKPLPLSLLLLLSDSRGLSTRVPSYKRSTRLVTNSHILTARLLQPGAATPSCLNCHGCEIKASPYGGTFDENPSGHASPLLACFPRFRRGRRKRNRSRQGIGYGSQRDPRHPRGRPPGLAGPSQLRGGPAFGEERRDRNRWQLR